MFEADLTGKIFAKLTVLSDRMADIGNGKKRRMCECRCECGNIKNIRRSSLLSGNNKSCGCMKQQGNHGLCPRGKKTRTYSIWIGIRSRCRNEKDKMYYLYGGRGISVCARWSDFASFLEDMGEPGPLESIDRIDPNGNYEPGNCRWATAKEQMNNTRRNVLLTWNGKTQTIGQWADDLPHMPRRMLYHRHQRGWSDEEILTTPPAPSGRWK